MAAFGTATYFEPTTPDLALRCFPIMNISQCTINVQSIINTESISVSCKIITPELLRCSLWMVFATTWKMVLQLLQWYYMGELQLAVAVAVAVALLSGAPAGIDLCTMLEHQFL